MALAQNDQASPDFDLAYVLATASYCAYAVGQADADRGQKRAFQCLNVAAQKDPEHQLGVFQDIGQDKVEAYFDPDAPENAYLLIQTETGIILAFRGTLTPPLSPSGGRFRAAAADAVAKYKEREAMLLATFIADWKNDLTAEPDPRDRHQGFDKAWDGLQAHLIAKDCGPTTGAAPVDCSKFLSFVSQLRHTASLRLYVTGHSKGGALATLAALDIPNHVGVDIVPVVYTFAGAKALTADGAERYAGAVKDMWRFEHEYDIVPSVPPDRTVATWLLRAYAYAHVGRRAFFAKGQPPQLSSGPKHGVDEPGGDKDRLTAAALNLLSSAVPLFNPADPIGSITSLAENNCRSLVDNHFLIFADVQELVRARHAGAPTATTEENLDQSFFYTGLPDGKGEILWGYSQWCSLLNPAPPK